MMQKLTAFLFFLCLAHVTSAQLSVLFVDDSGDNFGNAEYVASAFDSLGYETVFFDAIGQNVSPTAADMSDYDLVVWYTSTWGTGLQLWNGSNMDNPELRLYLAQPDAHLWLIGLDYFYDRYGPAPVTFQSGDFAYDHLGITQYLVQSYADDDSLGVPVVQPAPGQPIPGLADLHWRFTTLWYADGFELLPTATPVYLFGDANYVLSGQPTGVLYHPFQGAEVLTYGFDLALTADFELLREHVATVMDWWTSELTPTHAPATESASIQVVPAPFYDHVDIRIKPTVTTSVMVAFYNATGQVIKQLTELQPLFSGQEKIIPVDLPASLPAGFYYCKIQLGQQINTIKLIKG